MENGELLDQYTAAVLDEAFFAIENDGDAKADLEEAEAEIKKLAASINISVTSTAEEIMSNINAIPFRQIVRNYLRTNPKYFRKILAEVEEEYTAVDPDNKWSYKEMYAWCVKYINSHTTPWTMINEIIDYYIYLVSSFAVMLEFCAVYKETVYELIKKYQVKCYAYLANSGLFEFASTRDEESIFGVLIRFNNEDAERTCQNLSVSLHPSGINKFLMEKDASGKDPFDKDSTFFASSGCGTAGFTHTMLDHSSARWIALDPFIAQLKIGWNDWLAQCAKK